MTIDPKDPGTMDLEDCLRVRGMSAPTAKAVARLKYQLYDAMIRDGGPSVLQLRVAWRLIDRTNRETGDAWPSYETLADELGVNVRSVIRAIKCLIKNDWFEARHGGGRGKSNHYRPCWQRVTDESPFRETETVTGESINSDSRGKKTVTSESPEPLREPLIESDRASDFQNSPSNTAAGRSRQDGENVVNATAVNARQGNQQQCRHRVVAGNGSGNRDDGGGNGENFETLIDYLVEKQAYTDDSHGGWGGGRSAARDAVDRLRSSGGDAAAIRCFEDGRAKGLFGPVLRRHVESRAKFFEDRHQRAAG